MVDIICEREPSVQLVFTNLSTTGLGLLHRAYHYALDLVRDPWDFAVEIGELQAVGMTNGEFRWLLCKGFLEHAREIPTDDIERRQFSATESLSFYNDSCFQLTEMGLHLASQLLDNALEKSEGGTFGAGVGQDLKPRWDGERHQFFVRDQLVKEFKVPSPNQETILAAFQEENWPARIDDPLAPTSPADSKRRLHDTIKSLNRNQKQNLIRFLGDGTGEGVFWELTDSSALSWSGAGQPLANDLSAHLGCALNA
ncbi:MAG: hypothetical protein KF861_16680 [Planctomycetaceae bacterium]|nr:hypothetical protein [Planctomycetaceae bacterium]